MTIKQFHGGRFVCMMVNTNSQLDWIRITWGHTAGHFYEAQRDLNKTEDTPCVVRTNPWALVIDQIKTIVIWAPIFNSLCFMTWIQYDQSPHALADIYDFPAMMDYSLKLWAQINPSFLSCFSWAFCQNYKRTSNTSHLSFLN